MRGRITLHFFNFFLLLTTSNAYNYEDFLYDFESIHYLAFINQYKVALEENIISDPEEPEKDSIKRCATEKNIQIDIDQLKVELRDCVRNSMKQTENKLEEMRIQLKANTTLLTSLAHLEDIIEAGGNLKLEQDHFLAQTVLAPICSLLKANLTECVATKYEFIKQSQACRSSVEKDLETFGKMLVQDVCTNNAGWILEVLDDADCKCKANVKYGLKSVSFKHCSEDLAVYKPKTAGKTIKRIENEVEFCNVTRRLGSCLADVFTSSCPDNPKLHQTLLNTFQTSRSWYSTKCNTTTTFSSAATTYFKKSYGGAAGWTLTLLNLVGSFILMTLKGYYLIM